MPLRCAVTVRWVFALQCCLATGCGQVQPSVEADSSAESIRAKIVRLNDPAGLHNLHRIGDAIYSGSEPHGEEGFASLAKLGIKTIVSVDGARPDLEIAHQHGLRYVHIPIGYDGIDEQAAGSLTRVARESERPVYVHCHHGKHRGPAAAAIVCAAAEIVPPGEQSALLKAAGTGAQYAGLWRDLERFVPPDDSADLPPLVEVAEVGSFAAAMAQLDRHTDHLELMQQAEWSVPAGHPDLVAVQEAVIVREGLREANRLLTPDDDATFKSHMAAAEELAGQLEEALKAHRLDEASDRMRELRMTCQQCHEKYRN